MLPKFKSQHTDQDALCLALRYAHQFGLTNTFLSREYDLSRRTLCDISAGKCIKKNYKWYYDSLILALNDSRLCAKYMHKERLEQEIKLAIFNIGLVHVNIAPDDENH